MSLSLHTIYTVWIYWPEDDAIEMHGAVDANLRDANPDYYTEMLVEARAKVGGHNVREIKVEVPWNDIVVAFDPPVLEGRVA